MFVDLPSSFRKFVNFLLTLHRVVIPMLTIGRTVLRAALGLHADGPGNSHCLSPSYQSSSTRSGQKTCTHQPLATTFVAPAVQAVRRGEVEEEGRSGVGLDGWLGSQAEGVCRRGIYGACRRGNYRVRVQLLPGGRARAACM